MSWNDHGLDYAEKYHRHYDLEREDTALRQLIQGLQEGVRELSGELASAHTSIGKLEETVSVYGELIDEWRNRVYALERDVPRVTP